MTCQELRACLGAHLDGEMDLSLSLAADEHLAFCVACQWAYARERELRTLVRTRFPREGAPAALGERIRGALARAERGPRIGAPRRWFYWAVPAAALILVALGVGLWQRSAPPPVVRELVAKHAMYSRLDAPAEIVSASQEAVAGWFKGKVRFGKGPWLWIFIEQVINSAIVGGIAGLSGKIAGAGWEAAAYGFGLTFLIELRKYRQLAIKE